MYLVIKERSLKNSPSIPDFTNLVLLERLPFGGRCRCIPCDRVFSSWTTGRQHLEILHPDNPEYYECNICQKVIKSKRLFRNHIGSKHKIRGRNIVSYYGRQVEEKYYILMNTSH